MERSSRRNTLVRLALIPAAAVFGLGCKKGPDCTDTSALSGPELTQRKAVVYVDQAADATKACKLCALYQAKGPDECGGCSLFKGPVSPEGSCKSYAPKV